MQCILELMISKVAPISKNLFSQYSARKIWRKNVIRHFFFLPGVDLTISDARIQEMSSCVSSKLNCAILELRKLFLIDNMMDSIKFGLGLWFVTYIGAWFNAMTLVILAWVGLFTIPKVNDADRNELLTTVRF